MNRSISLFKACSYPGSEAISPASPRPPFYFPLNSQPDKDSEMSLRYCAFVVGPNKDLSKIWVLDIFFFLVDEHSFVYILRTLVKWGHKSSPGMKSTKNNFCSLEWAA